MSESQNASQLIRPIERILSTLSILPRWWKTILIIAAVVSMFSGGISEAGKFFIKVSFSTITVVLVALIWLPSLLRIIVLMGGGMKMSDTEVSMPGLLTLFPKVLVALDAAESQLPDARHTREIVKEAREIAEVELAMLIPSVEQAREQLTNYAQRYELIQCVMEPGPKRTTEMMTLAAEVRTLARRVNFGPSEISNLFMSGSEGNRIIALESLIATALPACFDIVLQAIGTSKSAFEQSAALRAAENMLPLLKDEQKQQLAAVIEEQSSGGEGKFITRDSDRWIVSRRILEAIKKRI